MYFKEYLEKHPEKIVEYKELKEKLANLYSEDRKQYTACKNNFIQNIISLYKEENNLY